MFQMSKKDFKQWRKKSLTAEGDRQGLRYAPFCFTEQGVTMLSCVLNSRRAIAVNLQVTRIFTRLRKVVLTHKDILLKLEQLAGKVNRQDGEIKLIFEYLKELLNPKAEPMRKIGFKQKGSDDRILQSLRSNRDVLKQSG
jgi:hypothetical protein